MNPFSHPLSRESVPAGSQAILCNAARDPTGQISLGTTNGGHEPYEITQDRAGRGEERRWESQNVGAWEKVRINPTPPRFSAEEPMPKRLWERWLAESYELSAD